MYNIKRTKEKLLEILENIKKNNEKKDKELLSVFLRNNQVFFMDHDSYNNFYDVITEIMKNNPVRTNFENELIREKVLDIISFSLAQPEDNQADFIEIELEKLNSEFKGKIKDWTFLVPIYNLEIEDTISMGTVKFLKFDKKFTSEFKNNFLNKDFFEKNYINKSKGMVYAETKVHGVKQPAYYSALYQIRLTLNTFKLYISPRGSQFGLFGEITPYQHIIVYNFNENEKWGLSKQLVGMPPNFRLNKEFMQNPILDELNRILNEFKPTEFEKRLLIAIYWFGEAMTVPISKPQIYGIKDDKHENLEYFRLAERIIKLFTSLESILIEDEERRNKSENLATRGSKLLTHDKKQYEKDYSNFKTLYWVRGEIVHRGDTFVFQKELDMLTSYTRNILQYLIELNKINKFEDIMGLIKYIEALEMK